MSKFCTCHDSSAVMTCAKLWPDLIIIIIVKARIIFTRFQLWAHKTFAKQVPGNAHHQAAGYFWTEKYLLDVCHAIYKCWIFNMIRISWWFLGPLPLLFYCNSNYMLWWFPWVNLVRTLSRVNIKLHRTNTASRTTVATIATNSYAKSTSIYWQLTHIKCTADIIHTTNITNLTIGLQIYELIIANQQSFRAK